MIATFFSTQSRKAWIGGIVAAGLTPVLQLLAEGTPLTIGTGIAAVATGALTALGVYQITNEKNPADLLIEQKTLQAAVDSAVAAVKAKAPAPVLQQILDVSTTVDHLLAEANKDFGGQTVSE